MGNILYLTRLQYENISQPQFAMKIDRNLLGIIYLLMNYVYDRIGVSK